MAVREPGVLGMCVALFLMAEAALVVYATSGGEADVAFLCGCVTGAAIGVIFGRAIGEG
jgi:hypothetical protein